MRIAINGMGRIGRMLFRRLVNDETIQLVAVNDLMNADNLAYLLKYDSLYGAWPQEITVDAGIITTGRKQIAVLQQANPANINWRQYDVDILLECSGRFSSKESATTHLTAGAKKVLLSTTGSTDIPLLIYGHNHIHPPRRKPLFRPEDV